MKPAGLRVKLLPVLLSGLFLAGAAPAAAPQPEEKKWLQEDVAFILTPEEREAFLHLNSDEEREQFIEQFWLRRDPTPDSVENEFREEHYRRIASANERFSSGQPGWQT